MAASETELCQRIEEALDKGAQALVRVQAEDGSFDLGFDGGTLPDAHLIFVAHMTELGLGDVLERLVRRLLDRQLATGGWPQAPGSAPHLSTSVEAYIALRVAGLARQERSLLRARRFIIENGGTGGVVGPSIITMALLGLYPWPETVVPPPEIALLPPEAPISLFRVGAMLRLHLLPLLVLRAQEAVFGRELGEQIASELGGATRATYSGGAGGELQDEALASCVSLMTERLDEDGTLGGLLMATGWAALAAKALKLREDHPLVRETARGLRSLVHEDDRRSIHAMVCRPTVRSTALGLQALRASGAQPEAIVKGRDFLLAERAEDRGDFEILGPVGPAVAWSIKPRSRRFPSLLDTLYVVSALSGLEGTERVVANALDWVRSMQRSDGGFSLFDRDVATAPWLRRLSMGLLTHTLNDSSSPEVTGRVLEASAQFGFLERRGREAALDFLRKSQQRDGSWQGAFSLGCFPATSAALVALATNTTRPGEALRRGIEFIVERQHRDGGWGERPGERERGGAVDLGRSTAGQTARALCGLMAASHVFPMCRAAIDRGVWYLLWSQEPDGTWVHDDPSAASLAEVVHLNDPVEHLARPLLVLRAFRDNFLSSWVRKEGSGG